MTIKVKLILYVILYKEIGRNDAEIKLRRCVLMLTMPTSESSEMDSTNMVTPTVTAFPKISCNCILGNEAG